ncbi:hypothetical protein JDN40_02440 [Rhodomicrobium vannielii ATCC 17100]|uniref:hypothetical protein n=1 Tax=Rhodomicrobium vannielii TaxID=1069 RepID=UPI001917BF15|nr:hypothetical protein [Rhodomicrobium vannielii]MBJ7532974.1 hypothetical protein [Rhodomicrobium vannielii ATCC 17100]
MNQLVATLRANKWFVAACFAAIFLGYEFNHANSGVFHTLIRLAYSPFSPPGPFRLTVAQHKAVKERLKAEFGKAVPFHKELGETIYFKRNGRDPDCYYGDDDINLSACNDIEITNAGFEEVLRYSSLKAQHIMYRQTATSLSKVVNWFFFIGTRDTPQIIIDLSRVSILFMQAGKIRVVVTDGNNKRELVPTEIAHLIFLLDDPGPSTSSLSVQMVWPKAPEMRPAVLGEVAIQGGLEQRHRFFTAVIGHRL